MAKLIYSAITSLDGYVADATGGFDWAAPDDEVHRFVNDMERAVGTHLYGRRMYEVMAFWESWPAAGGQSGTEREYAEIWRSADKVVYSTTLTAASTERTTIERAFDPDAVRRMKETADRDISVGGPTLAGAALRAGLVDELHLFLVPVLVGGGLRALPEGLHRTLELVGERRFGGGVVHLRYRVES